MLEITRTKGRLKLKLNAINLGEDLCVIITGGDRPHLGAVTVGSKHDEECTYCFPHHKEHHVTKMLYEHITASFDRNVIVCCGIHVDNISAEEIDTVLTLCKEMIVELMVLKNI